MRIHVAFALTLTLTLTLNITTSAEVGRVSERSFVWLAYGHDGMADSTLLALAVGVGWLLDAALLLSDGDGDDVDVGVSEEGTCDGSLSVLLLSRMDRVLTAGEVAVELAFELSCRGEGVADPVVDDDADVDEDTDADAAADIAAAAATLSLTCELTPIDTRTFSNPGACHRYCTNRSSLVGSGCMGSRKKNTARILSVSRNRSQVMSASDAWDGLY